LTVQSYEHAIIGVDTGGTFTDVIVLDPVTGRMTAAKVPSSPADPSQGFIAGIDAVLGGADPPGRAVGRVLHGTTVATNLILEGKGPPTALLTTAGFKYVLEIGRQDIPRRSSLFAWVKPKRPVPPQSIYEIDGRIDHTGTELTPLDEETVAAAAQAIKAEGIAAIAIVFLHSYANPAHEQRAGDIVRSAYPEALVSLSSDVLPVFREYERSMTTILNVHVMPVVSSYVARLQDRLRSRDIAAPLLLMKSSGGVTGSSRVQRVPVETVLSGPAAGAVGAAFLGAGTGFSDLIGIDIGGTSADITLIHGGEPGLTTTGHIGEWPLALPMIDITTIGAGSIARVSADCRAAKRWRRTRTGLLRPGRHRTHRHRCAPRPRPSAALPARRLVRARCRSGTPCSRHSRRQIAGPWPRGRGARHPGDRRQPHDRRDPRRLG
jgi:N-methylhydantoinase A